MNDDNIKTVAIIVSHPEEETIWAGGTILSHPGWKCFVVCLTKNDDPEWSPRFFNALKLLNSEGVMGQLDDKIAKSTLRDSDLESEIIHLIPNTHFDLIITHNGYDNPDNPIQNRVNKTVVKLFNSGIIEADELWTFAPENGEMKYLSNPNDNVEQLLTDKILNRKNNIITRIFGSYTKSQHTNNTALTEAFWQYKDAIKSKKDLKYYGYGLNIFRAPTIEALKFIYNKSKFVVNEIDSWLMKDAPFDNEVSFEHFTKSNSPYKYFGKELKIFQKSTIENLKSRYYENLSFLFDIQKWKTNQENELSLKTDLLSFNYLKKPRVKSKELNIFKTPSIDSLRSLYKKSIWPIDERNKLEPEIVFCCEDLNNNSNQNELNIFKCLSVDYLKTIYYQKTK